MKQIVKPFIEKIFLSEGKDPKDYKEKIDALTEELSNATDKMDYKKWEKIRRKVSEEAMK
jgi:ribosomal protein S18